jgi:ATP synthase H subunit
LSGVEAVRKIVDTESQARQIVDEATRKSQDIINDARQEADRIKTQAGENANREREKVLARAREEAENEARKSDIDTDEMLDHYRRLAEDRKEQAVQKAVELILGA